MYDIFLLNPNNLVVLTLHTHKGSSNRQIAAEQPLLSNPYSFPPISAGCTLAVFRPQGLLSSMSMLPKISSIVLLEVSENRWHTYNPSTWKMKRGRPKLKGWPGLHSESLSQNTTNKKTTSLRPTESPKTWLYLQIHQTFPDSHFPVCISISSTPIQPNFFSHIAINTSFFHTFMPQCFLQLKEFFSIVIFQIW